MEEYNDVNLQELEGSECSVKGTVTKQTKRLFETLSKINKEDNFFLCIKRNKLLMVSCGVTQSHYFEISKDIEIQTTFSDITKVLKVDPQQFYNIVEVYIKYTDQIKTFLINSLFFLVTQQASLIISNEFNFHKLDQVYEFKAQVNCLFFNEDHLIRIKQILLSSRQDVIFEIQMDSAQQLKLVLFQLKALKTSNVSIEVDPQQQRQLTWYYDTTPRHQMKFVFSNIQLQAKQDESVQFYYNGKEMIHALGVLEKDSHLTIKIQRSGKIIIHQQSEYGDTQSILEPITNLIN